MSAQYRPKQITRRDHDRVIGGLRSGYVHLAEVGAAFRDLQRLNKKGLWAPQSKAAKNVTIALLLLWEAIAELDPKGEDWLWDYGLLKPGALRPDSSIEDLIEEIKNTKGGKPCMRRPEGQNEIMPGW